MLVKAQQCLPDLDEVAPAQWDGCRNALTAQVGAVGAGVILDCDLPPVVANPGVSARDGTVAKQQHSSVVATADQCAGAAECIDARFHRPGDDAKLTPWRNRRGDRRRGEHCWPRLGDREGLGGW